MCTHEKPKHDRAYGPMWQQDAEVWKSLQRKPGTWFTKHIAEAGDNNVAMLALGLENEFEGALPNAVMNCRHLPTQKRKDPEV